MLPTVCLPWVHNMYYQWFFQILIPYYFMHMICVLCGQYVIYRVTTSCAIPNVFTVLQGHPGSLTNKNVMPIKYVAKLSIVTPPRWLEVRSQLHTCNIYYLHVHWLPSSYHLPCIYMVGEYPLSIFIYLHSILSTHRSKVLKMTGGYLCTLVQLFDMVRHRS